MKKQAFISFSSLTANPSEDSCSNKINKVPNSFASLAPVYDGSDSVLNAASKKLLKKDTTTKIKGLNDITNVFQSFPAEGSDIYQDNLSLKMKEFLPYFCYVYPRLALDNGRKVREQLNFLLEKLIKVDRKLLQPYMKQLLGYWWLLTADPAEEVKCKAINCFEEAIPMKKRQTVLHFLAPSILEILDRVLNENESSNSNEAPLQQLVTTDEESERIERINVSSLMCLKSLMANLSASQNSSLIEQYKNLLSEQLWKKSMRSPLPLIRNSTYKLLGEICSSDSTVNIITSLCSKPKGNTPSPMILEIVELLSEGFEANIGCMLNCFMAILHSKEMASLIWSGPISIQKHLMPKMRTLAQKHSEKAIPFLLPIVGTFPIEKIDIFDLSPPSKQTQDGRDIDSLCELIEAVSEIAEKDKSFSADICAVELSVYLLLRRRSSSKEEVLMNANDMNEKRVRLVIRFLIQHITLIIHTLAKEVITKYNNKLSSDKKVDWKCITIDFLSRIGVSCEGIKSGTKGDTSLVDLSAALSRSMMQLQRATSMGLNMSTELWKTMFWGPLNDQILSLIYSTYSHAYTDVSIESMGKSILDDFVFNVVLETKSVLTSTFSIIEMTIANCRSSNSQSCDELLAILKVAFYHCLENVSYNEVGSDPIVLSKILSSIDFILFSILRSRTLQLKYDSDVLELFSTLTGQYLPKLLQHLAPSSTSTQSYSFAVSISVLIRDLLGVLADSHKETTVEFRLPYDVSCQNLARLSRYSAETDCIAAIKIILYSFLPKNLTAHSQSSGEEVQYLIDALNIDKVLFSWLHDNCTKFLSVSCAVSLIDKVQILMASSRLFYACKSSHVLTMEALTKWQINNGEKTCCWFILSLLFNNLNSPNSPDQKHVAVDSDEENSIIIDPSRWLVLHFQFILERLVSLFFARVRGSEDSATTSLNLTESVIELPRVISNWDDVRIHLLPILPKNIQDELFLTVSAALNSPFALPLTALESVKHPQFSKHGNKDVTTKLQPKKWSRHCVEFIHLLNTSKRSCCLHLLVKDYWCVLLHLLLRYWVESSNETTIVSPIIVNSELLSVTTYVLQCTQLLFPSIQRTNYVDLLSSWTPSYFVYVLLCTEVLYSLPHFEQFKVGNDSFDSLPSNMMKQYIDSMAQSPGFDSSNFILSVIDVASSFLRCSDVQSNFIFAKVTFARSYHEVINSALTQFIKSTLEALIPKISCTGIDRIRLSSPLAQEKVEGGSRVQYISSGDCSTDGELIISNRGGYFVEETKILKTLDAKVISSHSQAGEDTYYTICLIGAGIEGQREVQTEWNKLLFQASSGLTDCISVFNPFSGRSDTMRVDSKHIFTETQDNQTDPAMSISSWLAAKLSALCDLIFQESFFKNTDATTYLIFRHELKVFCVVYSHIGAYLDKERLECRESFAQDVANRLRGLVLYLTSLDAYVYSRAWSVGAELLSVSLCSKICIGNGVWLPNVLRNLMMSLNIVLDQQKDNARDEFLAALMASSSALLTYTIWQRAAEFAFKLIPVCLASLPSRNVPTFAPSLICLLRRTWQHRALLSNRKNSSSRKFAASTASSKADETEGSSKISSSEAFSKDASITTTKLRWETEAFDFALFVFVEGIKYRGISREMQQEARMNACLALHYCLLPLNRQTAVELLSPSTLQTFIPRLQSMMTSPVDIDDNKSYNASSSNTWSSYRLIACKLLDVWTVGREEEQTEVVPSLSSQSMKAATNDGESESLPSDWLQEAAAEFEKDRVAMQGVLGVEAMQSLLERFAEESVAKLVVNQAERDLSASDMSPADKDDNKKDYNNNEEDAAVERRDDDSQSVQLAGVSVTESSKFSQSESTMGSQKIGLKRRVQALRNADLLGSLLVWLVSMQRIDSMSLKDWTVRARCGNYLSKSGVLTNVMHLLLDVGKDLLKYKDVADTLKQVAYLEKSAFTSDSTRELTEAVSMDQLAIYALFRTVCTLPAMVRNFWTSDSCSRAQKLKLSRFIEERARNSIVAREMALVSLATKSGRWDSKELVVKGNAVSGEVTAVYMREETSVEMKITLPSAYPLRNVEVSCTSRIGMADGRWRRWVLQIIQLLSMQDGSVVDAVLMWKCNIEKELAGVEPCPICYCILHAKTLTLPTLACPTCRNKFHPTCLFTWFKSSGKSKCVICQQEFF